MNNTDRGPGPSMQRYRSHSGRPGQGERAVDGPPWRGWPAVALWFGLTGAAAAVGMLASGLAPSFYASLQKPVWAAPAWLFGPAWTVLYLLMACAAVMVHRRQGDGAQAGLALRWYVVALLPNALWSWAFFRWHQGALSLAVILTLLLLLVFTVVAFRRVHHFAAALMLPVTLWVSYASALNLALLRLNPGLL